MHILKVYEYEKGVFCMEDETFKPVETMTDEELYALAARKVKAKANFYVHVVVYVVILLLLKVGVGLDFEAWMIVACAWGIGVISQGVSAYTLGNHKAVSKEYEKLKNKKM